MTNALTAEQEQARIRDIPASCSCRWFWSPGPRRWILAEKAGPAGTGCSWHFRNPGWPA